MKLIDINSFCIDTNKFIRSKYKYQSDPIKVINEWHIMDKGRNNFSLYLRWFPTESWVGENTLVISKIRFTPRLQGTGTAFLKYIVKQSDKYQIDNVMIEMLNKESSGFAKKFGFTENIKEHKFCWFISIKDLSRYFQNFLV